MRGAGIVVLIALLATPAAAEPAAPLTGTVAGVAFRGNQRLTDARLAALVTTKRGDAYDADAVAADIEALWSTRAFTDVRVEARRRRRGVRLTFVVTERPTIRAVRFTGASGVAADAARAAVRLRRDTFYDETVANRDAAEARKALRELGHWHAKVDISTVAAKNAGELDVTVDVRPGPVVLIRKIDFHGNRHTSDEQLRALVATLNGTANVKGGIYSPDWLRADLYKITSHYYDDGRLEIKVADPVVTPSEDGLTLDIDVTVTEGPRYTLSKLSFTGDLLSGQKYYRKLCRSKVRKPFHRTRLANDIERIRADYAERGHPHPIITPVTRLDVDAHTVELTLEIEHGSP